MTDEEIKKEIEKTIEKLKQSFAGAFSQSLSERNKIDYICAQCDDCLFFGVDHDMSCTTHYCMVHKPKDFYGEYHSMRWVSGCDCARDEELRKFYYRKCKEFCSKSKTIKEKMKAIKENNNDRN